MTTFIFPGQGSQIKGMGQELFPQFPDIVRQADTILGYSVTDLCLQNPNDYLSQTQYTQPVLYIVNALHYIKEVHKGRRHNYLAGHSLGEYNALLAANVFDFITGLLLVQKRGELMSKATDGGMAAIIGFTADQVQSLLNKYDANNVNISNYNSHSQLVISGPKNDITKMQALFEEAGATLVIPLKVSGAFHSPYMLEAKTEFSLFLQDFTFKTPSIPVIANVSARPYDSQNTKEYLINQITAPVLWTQTVEYLLAKGEDDFVELGPGEVLTGLVSRTRSGK